MRRRAAAALLALTAAAAAAAPVPPAAPRLAGTAPAAQAAAPRPAPRPAGLRARGATPRAPAAEGLCGDPRLAGARIQAVQGAGACGIAQPVRLSGVAGVRVEPPVTVGCEAASALADWVERSVRPAARRTFAAEPAALRAFAGYACRTRNNRPGGKLSEHAKGRAVDIGGVRLSDGREFLLQGNWRGEAGRFFREIWRGACGPFGTVLGPDADRYHQDHFHLDVARYRSGPYCK
jgi:hypothetical protein